MENGDRDLIRAQNEGVGLELLAMQKLSAPANFPECQMNEGDFKEDYGSKMVSSDVQNSLMWSKDRSIDNGLFATVAESVPLLGNTFGFFGNDVEVNIYTSAASEDYGTPYTDLIFEIRNTRDGALEKKFSNLKNVTRFMVDVTTDSPSAVEKKIERAEETFQQGRLHYVHYFRSKMPGATLGIANVPNLILPINELELVSFLKQVRPYIDGERGLIINREKFQERYQAFAESLRQSLYRQAVEQIKAFSAACANEKIISNNDRDQINTLVDEGQINKAHDLAYKLANPPKGREIVPDVNKNKRGGFLQSLRVLLETAMSLDLIREKREQKENSLANMRKAA